MHLRDGSIGQGLSLERRETRVSRKQVQRLMRAMGLRAIYRRPGASRRSPEHPVYPYLLRNVRITRPNQVWAADITYLPMARSTIWPPPKENVQGRALVLSQPCNDSCQDPNRRALKC